MKGYTGQLLAPASDPAVAVAVTDPARPGHQELVGAGAVPQEGTAAGEFGQGKGD